MADASGPVLCVDRISKRFGATVALDAVSIEVGAGEIHGVFGENGAGKSTLMQILGGALRPDTGSIRFEDKPYRPPGPAAARAAGVAMTFQELMLAPHLTVEENLSLGSEVAVLGWVNPRARRKRAIDALRELHGSHIQPGAVVGRLPIAQRQLVEVARALCLRPRLLIMDEPTSSLARAEVDHLHDAIRRLPARGVSVLYVSHFLEDARAVCSRFTVLRDGRAVGAGALAATSQSELVRLMVGRELKEIYPRVPHEPGEPVLDALGLRGGPRLRSTGLRLHRGEILGVAGLVGAGRTELLRALFGLDRIEAGSIRTVHGPLVRGGPRERLERGIGFLSEDRKGEGLFLGRSVSDNLTLPTLARHVSAGLISERSQRAATEKWIERLGIRSATPRTPVAHLSGGNQQKVALARLLELDADVLLLDEPTRGIDVGTKAEIYRLMGELAARGTAILWTSSFLPELLGVSDTVAVICRGRVAGIRAADKWTEEAVLEAAMGGG